MPARLPGGLGVRTDVPTPAAPRSEPSPSPRAPASAALTTYEAAQRGGALKPVSAARARALEKQFSGGSAQVEDLSRGRVGASTHGMVVKGELFVRTAVVRPGAVAKWESAGRLQTTDTRPEVQPGGWAPKPSDGRGAEAVKVRRLVEQSMSLLTPDFEVSGAEATKLRKTIADSGATAIDATPRGLAGASLKAYAVSQPDDPSGTKYVFVEKSAVRPGAKPSLYYVGPLL